MDKTKFDKRVRQESTKADKLKIIVNGKEIRLIFQEEPNLTMAELVKKALITAYTRGIA